MANSVPVPHSCSSTRVNRTDGETYVTPTAVLDEEPCLFAPYQPGETEITFLGPGEVSKTILFIDYDADVNLGDEITNDATAEVFMVVEPPVHFQNPTDWSNDHQQIVLRRKPVVS